MSKSWRWILVAVATLLTAWLVAPAAVPIYDGAGFPDEPYRYVSAPDGKSTKAPTTAHATVQVDAHGLNSAAAYSNSAEQGPQVVLYVPTGALKAPAGVKTIQVTETPEASHPPLPSDGTIVTNVYRVQAMTSKGPAQIVGKGENQTPTLQMRAPSSKQPGPVFEHRGASGWTRSSTLRVGQDVYQTSAPEFGDWALVQLKDAPKTVSSSSRGGISVGLLAAGVAVLVIAGIILAIRTSRSRRAA